MLFKQYRIFYPDACAIDTHAVGNVYLAQNMVFIHGVKVLSAGAECGHVVVKRLGGSVAAMKTALRSVFVFLFFLILPEAAWGAIISLPQDSLARWLADGPPEGFILIDVREDSEISSMIGNESCKPYNLTWNSNGLAGVVPSIDVDIPLVVYTVIVHFSQCRVR